MAISNSLSFTLKKAQKNYLQSQKDASKKEFKEQFLLQRIAWGDNDAFWQLWLLYENYLYHRCQKWMGNNQMDAEEALSQARLKAWEKLPNYAAKMTNPKAWLTRMTHNLCVDIHRMREKAARNTDCIDEVSATESAIVGGNSPSPECEILNNELNIYLRQAINSLSPRLRKPLNLLYYDQMSYEEISYKLMISKDNVYKRVSQARNILKTQLNNYFTERNNSPKTNRVRQKQNLATNQKKYFRKSQKTEKHFAMDKFSVTKQESSEMSISFTEKNFIEIINYEVTALCLEKPLLAC